jgi:hypothetical protein
VHDLYEGWVEALRGLGEQVLPYNLGDRLTFYDAAHVESGPEDPGGIKQFRKAVTREQAIELAANGILSAAYKFWPDVVLLVSAFFTPPELLEILRARRHKIVILHTESPYQDDEQQTRGAYADINLLNDPANLDSWRALGPRAEYMPHAYRPAIHYPGNGGPRPYDLAFAGTGFPSRVEFFTKMDLQDLDVRLAGCWLDLPEDSPLRNWIDGDPEECIDNADTAALYRQAKTGINFYRREAEDAHKGEGWAIGPREIEMAACGLWFARDGRPESDQLFPMLPAFTDAREAGELIRWALIADGQREKAAAAAREAIADRTFENNARKLLAMLDR